MWLWRSLSADCYLLYTPWSSSLSRFTGPKTGTKVQKSGTYDSPVQILGLNKVSPVQTLGLFRGSSVQILQYSDIFCHRVYRVPGFHSRRRNWVTQPPHPQTSVAPPPQGGRHTRLRLGGRGCRGIQVIQFRRRDRHSGTLCVLQYLYAYCTGIPAHFSY
jgi:hypothetical protein